MSAVKDTEEEGRALWDGVPRDCSKEPGREYEGDKSREVKGGRSEGGGELAMAKKRTKSLSRSCLESRGLLL